MPEPAERAVSPRAELSCRGLRRNFGRLRVLRGVDVNVESGELLLVSGPNGSGKSTLLKCLAGLMAPSAGKVECRLDGESLETEERRRAIGFVSPDLAFYPELTTRENLDFFSRLRGVSPGRGGELLDRVGLPQDRAAGALSSGMTQRLRWSWALLHEPRILLLDEPFQNLDEPGRDCVSALLREHLATGLAVVANPDLLDLPDVASHLDLGR